MKKYRNKWKIRFYQHMNLKNRILILFLCSSIIPFLIIGLISYFTIYTKLSAKIENGVKNNLDQVVFSLENTIENMSHITQQLAFEGTVGKKLDLVLNGGQSYDTIRLSTELSDELNLITFTNPSIGLTMYYAENDDTYLFANSAVRDEFSPKKLPLLAKYYGISYYGPHLTNDRFNKKYVISTLRKVDIPYRDDIYVYVESGLDLTKNIFDYGPSGQNASYVIVDNTGRIAYSEVKSIFKEGDTFSNQSNNGEMGTQEGYYWFKKTTRQGLSVISLIHKSDYNQEINQWFMQVFLISIISLIVISILAFILLKLVYKPIHIFNQGIEVMQEHSERTLQEKTNIPEFDKLLDQFNVMKKQIWDLFAEVEKKEKRRADLEVEKLQYQINPHFLMNTLDTVHWLAVINKQDEIDRLVLSLNKLLHYNLGKLGESSTIQEELDAMKQYLILQQIRYDFEFDVQFDIDERLLDVEIPRFIIQPLVENSLYNGSSDEGFILATVKEVTEGIEISIKDNGSGMSEETIQSILYEQTSDKDRVGMGIGLNYVKRMIESYYDGKGKFEIHSVLGEGTSILLYLPIKE